MRSVTWIVDCGRFVNLVNELTAPTTVSVDPLAVANRLRPVLLQLARARDRSASARQSRAGRSRYSSPSPPCLGSSQSSRAGGVSPGRHVRHVSRLVSADLVRRTAGATGDRQPGRTSELTALEAERVLQTGAARGAPRVSSPRGSGDARRSGDLRVDRRGSRRAAADSRSRRGRDGGAPCVSNRGGRSRLPAKAPQPHRLILSSARSKSR